MKSFIVFSATGILVMAGCGDDSAKTPADVAVSVDAEGDTTAETDVAADVVEVVPEGPLARIFPLDPIHSESTVLVGLKNLAVPPTRLEGSFARVRSCTPDLDRGAKNTFNFQGGSIDTVSCIPEFKAQAVDGNFLHIEPPATPADDDGAFAELTMYHHMSVVHSYYSDFYGIKDRDHSLDAITNISTWTSSCDAWTPWTNAAYVPREGLDYVMLGLSLSDTLGDAIVFSGTAARNFAFDTTVIYHEYTHAILGATRLSGVFLDDQGFNNLPGALNEAYADYFSGTLTEQATVGQYALNDIAAADFCGAAAADEPLENLARDMTAVRRCPDDLVAEVHADSEIFSSALWAMRESLGKLHADSIAIYAVLQLTEESDFGVAAMATIEAARDILGDEKAAQVAGFFEERNLIACERTVPVASVGARELSLRHEGTRVFGDSNPFPGYTPGYMQYEMMVPEGTTRATITIGAQSGFGGPATVDIEGAFKFGGAIRYDLGQTVGGATHDAELTVFSNGNTLKMQNASGAVLRAGRWAMAIHNRSSRTLRVVSMDIVFE